MGSQAAQEGRNARSDDANAGRSASCTDCQDLRRRVDALGRVRFDLQKQVNELEARVRAAHALVAELEGRERARRDGSVQPRLSLAAALSLFSTRGGGA